MYSLHINFGGSHGSSNRAPGAQWRSRAPVDTGPVRTEHVLLGQCLTVMLTSRSEATPLIRNELLGCVTNRSLAQSQRALAHILDLEAAFHSDNVERVL